MREFRSVQTWWSSHNVINSRVRGVVSGVTGGGAGAGGQSAPRDFWLGNFCWRIGKKEARKKGKRGENWEEKKEKKENCEREGGKLELEVGKFFFFFCFSLLKTTEICFGSTKIRIFYREKAFHVGKKIRQNSLPPQKNMPVTPLGVVRALVDRAITQVINTMQGWKQLIVVLA